MLNWTRRHDAWIAEHCEGLEVLTCAEATTRMGTDSKRIHDSYLELYGDHWIKNEDDEYTPLPAYLTDPAAGIRAAEAWAAKDSEYRSWTLARAGTLLGQCMDDGHHYIHEGEAGLAWSLYDATGGPA
jgi:hypothetical protein